MADLDTYEDQVIVFEAVKTSDSSRLVSRLPLQPSNTQLLSPPGGSSRKPVSLKPNFDGASDENHISAMSHGSLPPSRAMHGQTLFSGAQSKTQPLSPSLDRMSQAPLSQSHPSGLSFRSTTLPHSSVGGPLIPHSGTTTPSSKSAHADGSVDMAGFDWWIANVHDRVKVLEPDLDDSTHVLVF